MWVRKAEGEGGARVDGLLAFIVLEINKNKIMEPVKRTHILWSEHKSWTKYWNLADLWKD